MESASRKSERLGWGGASLMVFCFIACRGDNDGHDGGAPALHDAVSAAVSSEATADSAAVPTAPPQVLKSAQVDAGVASSVRPASGAAPTLDPAPLIAPSSLAALGATPGPISHRESPAVELGAPRVSGGVLPNLDHTLARLKGGLLTCYARSLGRTRSRGFARLTETHGGRKRQCHSRVGDRRSGARPVDLGMHGEARPSGDLPAADRGYGRGRHSGRRAPTDRIRDDRLGAPPGECDRETTAARERRLFIDDFLITSRAACKKPLCTKIPILTTFEAPPGSEIAHVVGPCWGITVRSRSIVGTACAGCQQIFGGEIAALTALATESRNQAMHRLEAHAIAQGANAVLAMRFDSGELMQNTNEIVAYGTAVVLRSTAR